jgi:hypothetical protein
VRENITYNMELENLGDIIAPKMMKPMAADAFALSLVVGALSYTPNPIA